MLRGGGERTAGHVEQAVELGFGEGGVVHDPLRDERTLDEVKCHLDVGGGWYLTSGDSPL